MDPWEETCKYVFKSVRICRLTDSADIFLQKADVSLTSHDTSGGTNGLVAEASRPRRDYKEDSRKRNKPCGRKRLHAPTKSKLTNWFSPFLWSQIETAVQQAGKPWSPREITWRAKLLNKKMFEKLTEQVVGRWIYPKAMEEGISQWKDSVLAHVECGNAPGGGNTRVGILVRHSYRSQIPY